MNADDHSQPGMGTLEKRATQRLAADLSRFHRVLDQIEQHRVDGGASPEASPTAPRGQEHDPREYLECIDQCYRQLDESKAVIDAILPTPRTHMRRV